MKTTSTLALGAALTLASGAAMAEGDTRLSYEIELEFGVDSVVNSDVAANELTDIYGSADVALSYALSDRVSVFAGLTLESVLDPVDDRAFEDMGLYVGELGVELSLGNGTYALGKISPAFGMAWDAAPGFYGTGFAEDYELSEAIGLTGSWTLGAGQLSAAVFYADDTALSRSLGTDRGRNTVAAGGAGNTGKLNNIALQYDIAAGDTRYFMGARFLSAGQGDASDEKGVALGFAHALPGDIEVMGEIAAFDGWGGSTDDATFATLGASMARGAWTYSAAYTRRDISSTGVDHLASLGLDYTFKNDVTLTTGLGMTDQGGVKSTMLGVAVVIPLGG